MKDKIYPGLYFRFKEPFYKMCKGEFEILEVDYEKKVVYFDKYGAYKDICYTDPEILLSHAGFETINIL